MTDLDMSTRYLGLELANPVLQESIWSTYERVWDVDGREISDFHNAFGCMVQGHGHPAIVEAISEQVRRGTAFTMATEVEIEFEALRWLLINVEGSSSAIRFFLRGRYAY